VDNVLRQKAASQLKRQRTSLQKQHKDILAALNKASGQTLSEDITQRIQTLRIAFRRATIEGILVSETIAKKMFVLNFGAIIDAHTANMRLGMVIYDVLKTLNAFEPKESPK
jgi:hypothetical protein